MRFAMHSASGRDALGCQLIQSSFLNNPRGFCLQTGATSTRNRMSLKYPQLFSQVYEETKKKIIESPNLPIVSMPTNTRVMRSVAKESIRNAHSSRIAKNTERDNRFNGALPAGVRLPLGCSAQNALYLSEGVISLGKEGIFYGFKKTIERVALEEKMPSRLVADYVSEENIFSRAFHSKDIYVYRLSTEKKLVSLDPERNDFLKDLSDRWAKIPEVKNALRNDRNVVRS